MSIYTDLIDNLEILKLDNIKNIILNAAFIAAGRDEAVGMGAILYAVKNEYYKLGRTLGRDFFGRYWDEVINIMES